MFPLLVYNILEKAKVRNDLTSFKYIIRYLPYKEKIYEKVDNMGF